ncbi:tumor necrosis factor receptor superfamily member 6 [Engraulis encrasicolus]|uniref:tumor necrosis factor receptor superfamily member 6 n=1 Tax=Engraulis encrasicolus TaxID=184585 RepID=UPI002FCF267C
MVRIINEDRMICVLLMSVLVTFANGHLPRHRRQGGCQHGNYTHEGKTCCMCPMGHYVRSHCTADDKHSTTCDWCETGKTYTAEANSLSRCDICLECNDKANLVEDRSCTRISNTVCGCEDGYFCEEDDCRACHPCKSCETGEEVSMPCSKGNDTICKPEGTNLHGVIGVAVGVGIVIVAVIGYLTWKKKWPCFAKKNDAAPEPNEPNGGELEPLQGMDLMPYVRDIAEHLRFSDMAKVAARTRMPEVQIQRHRSDHPLEEEEQVVSLLKAWIEYQGLENASGSLIRTLRICKLNEKAKTIQRILTEARTAEQP